MKFSDKEHQKFWNKKYKKMEQLGKTNVYYKSLVYILGVCKTTRDNFENIFDLKKGEINIDSLQKEYQTGTSKKVTRMAFCLWNDCMYDSVENLEKDKKSSAYNPSEIFSCSYAPYFYEGIKLRYPEYTIEYQARNDVSPEMLENIEKTEDYEMNY